MGHRARIFIDGKKLEAHRTEQVRHEFVVGQFIEDCILGLDFLSKCGMAVDSAAGVLRGAVGVIKIVTLARGGDTLSGRTQGTEPQTQLCGLTPMQAETIKQLLQ